MDRIKRTGKIELISLVLLVQAGCLVWSQESGPAAGLERFVEKYGNDPRLVNGEKYYYPYAGAEGDPFLADSGRLADLYIGKREFSGQRIRYDVYNQQLVLDYETMHGARSSLVLPGERVDSFRIGPRVFTSRTGPEGDEEFLQVVHEGNISCYFKWEKEYQLKRTSGVKTYFFTEPVRESYILMNGEFHRYRNNRSFRKIFEKEIRGTIRDFMRSRRIRIRHAGAEEMRQLVAFCNSLIDHA